MYADNENDKILSFAHTYRFLGDISFYFNFDIYFDLDIFDLQAAHLL